MVLDFLAVDNFDFMRKIVKKILVEKCWSFVKIEFMDKNLTFRIVWIWIFPSNSNVCFDFKTKRNYFHEKNLKVCKIVISSLS